MQVSEAGVRTAAIQLLSCIALTGCQLGITEGDPKVEALTFEVPIGYQAAHRLADEHARVCHQGASLGGFHGGSWAVQDNLYTDTRTGVVYVNTPRYGTDLERIEVRAVDDQRTLVTAKVWGRGLLFNRDELDAIANSLRSGSVYCHGGKPEG